MQFSVQVLDSISGTAKENQEADLIFEGILTLYVDKLAEAVNPINKVEKLTKIQKS